MSDGPALHGPATVEYERATRPHNSSGSQRPAFVAVPADAPAVAAIVTEAGVQRGPYAFLTDASLSAL